MEINKTAPHSFIIWTETETSVCQYYSIPFYTRASGARG